MSFKTKSKGKALIVSLVKPVAYLSMSYDALNRVKQISYAGGAKLVYTYDTGANSLGRLSTLTDPNGGTSYGYDSHGRVISDTRTINTRTFVTQYRYDAYGRLDRITYPSGRLVNDSFDTQGRINGITTTSPRATFTAVQTTQYAPFGGATGLTLGNGFTANRAIDLDGRISSYSLGNATMSLGYDAASRISSAQESGSTVSRIFDYDPLDRLIHTQVPSAVYDYRYDAVGNRLTEKIGPTTYNYTYPTTSHRLASVSGPKARSFSYDANGSMTDNGSQQFVYNSLGRLHQVITAQGTYQYRINGLGQRVMKIPPIGNRTIFHYDKNGQLLAETDGLGVVVKEFIWHGATPVAIVLPPTSTKPERIYYIHADQLNAPRVVVNNTNAVVWRWDPEPFGTDLPNEDVDGNGEKLVMNLRYPGQYYDQETGLNYNNFRDYDSSIGRYVQSDPIGLAGGINTYTYVGGNPVNSIDPLGLDIAVIENGPTSGNPIGHTAIAITGHGIASSGNSTTIGSSLTDYLKREVGRRDTKISIIPTNPEQDVKAWEELKKHHKYIGLPYTYGNCSDLSNDALDKAGIEDTNLYPGTSGDLNRLLPGHAGARAAQAGATIVDIPKNSTSFPDSVNQFNPR
ncbi:MAG: RHS repeat-associated core domain-containing protein [Methylococcaceae bacterium]|nr:RHS repeat-associated core domain-containing protein [Methylococcaceae bacterium]